MPGCLAPRGRNGTALAGFLLTAGGLLGLAPASAAAGGAAGGHTAIGETGRGHLVVVLDHARLTITLTARARDVTGLDHPPADAGETAQLAAALERLRSGDTLFLVPATAWCRPISSAVTTPDGGGAPEAGLQATWQFHCAAPAALQWIEARLLTVFPGIRKLETSATTVDGVKSVVLTAGTPRFLLPRPLLPRQ